MSRPFQEVPRLSEPPANNVYYTIPEYSRLTGLHRNTIMTWIKLGRLKAKNPGGRNWHIDKCYYKKK